MMNQEELVLHVKKKFRMGYSQEKLRTELMEQGYSDTEISNAMLLSESIPKPAGSPWAILISVIFIILGIWRIADGMMIWGVVLLGWGVISLIIRLVQVSKN